MPYADQHCGICGDFVKGNNLTRHVKRWHGDADSTDSESGRQQSPGPRSRSPRPSRKSSDKPMSPPPISEEYIRNAVLCMLRRVEQVNLPSLSSYLGNHFPDIPKAWQMPIVISAFTAAQKVAATHGDAVICDDEVRATFAKKSLVRWTHGLSAVEPGYTVKTTPVSQHSRDPSSSFENRNMYSPVTNFLLDREMPVPFDSRYAVTQMQREVDELMEIDVLQSNTESHGTGDDEASTGQSIDGPSVKTNPVDDVLVSVALTSVTSSIVSGPSMSVIVPVETTFDKSDSVGNVASSGELLAENCQDQPVMAANQSIPAVRIACPLSPMSFADLLTVPDADDELMTRPLSICLTPLHTPNHTQSDSDECGASVVQLHPSPCPSLEKTPEHTTTEERAAMKVPLSTEVSERTPLMRVKVVKSSEVDNGDTVPTDQSRVEVESDVRGGDDAELGDSDQSRRSVTESNVIPRRDETKKRDDDKSSRSMRGERCGEQRRHDKENVKKLSHDDERRRSSPKRPKYPSSMVAEKPQRKELAVDANGETGFKIPLKPNRDTRRDRPVVSPLASSSRDVYSDRHRERSGADRRPLATVNRHDSDRRPPSDAIRRWNPSNRVDNRGLTREQQRWLERMPQHW